MEKLFKKSRFDTLGGMVPVKLQGSKVSRIMDHAGIMSSKRMPCVLGYRSRLIAWRYFWVH